MKKSATYYFLLIGILNVLLALFNYPLTTMMQETYGSLFGGKALPHLTELFLHYHWWAYIFVVLSVIGFVAGLITQIQDKVLLHCVILLLLVDGFVIFCASVAYMIPFMTVNVNMSA